MSQADAFTIGAVSCQVVPDGVVPYPAAYLALGVALDELQTAFAGNIDAGGLVPLAYNCLLLRVEGQTVLVDAGLGAEAATHMGLPAGRLLESLAGCGVTPLDIDAVVISHAHGDHIGGLTTLSADGERLPVFARARHYFSRDEWDYWTSPQGLAEVTGRFAEVARTQQPALPGADVLAQTGAALAEMARTQLPPLQRAGLIELVDEETELFPGVRMLPATGHTHGHIALLLGPAGGGAIYVGDALLNEIHFEHPEWVSVYESEPAMSLSTRRSLIERSVAESRMIIGFHLPRRGYAEKSDNRYIFHPVADDP